MMIGARLVEWRGLVGRHKEKLVKKLVVLLLKSGSAQQRRRDSCPQDV